jgi:pimeloyl-ACP methyl ester carboxylesterase
MTGITAHPVTRLLPVSPTDRLWSERSGPNAGTPVVLLHGSVQDSRLWDRIVPGLDKHHPTVRYDARGLGRSTPPSAPFRSEADLLAVLDAFGFERAALVGLSMGGEVALNFTLDFPERVASLALVSASMGGYDWPSSPEMDAYVAANRGSDAARLAELELSIWAPLNYTAPGFDIIEPMVRENAAIRAAVPETAKNYPLPAAHKAVSCLDRVTAPTLVIVGEDDHPEIKRIARLLGDGIPGARFEAVPGADHYLPLRTPAVLLELLLDLASQEV